MFSIGIRYLCGWACATSSNKEKPEWPPHPDRAYMALASAHYETNGDSNEREALEWLEKLGPPQIAASRPLSFRASVTVYVPINDNAAPFEQAGKKGVIRFPFIGDSLLCRNRQPRQFPAVIPESDTVYLIWPNVELSDERRAALERLCAKVGYIGDTSSLVQMWVEDNPPPPTLVPADPLRYTQRLRVFRTLAELEADYKRDNEAGEYRPRSFKWGYYREPEEERPPAPASHFEELLILRRTAGPALHITDTLWLTKTLHDAAINLWQNRITQRNGPPVPEWLSGHTPDGQRSRRENGHLAFVALPNVGHEHADGELKGIALAVPWDVTREDQGLLMDALFPLNQESGEIQPLQLTLGRLGVWRLEQESSAFPRMVTLRKSVWIGPADRWASVTPIVLDRYPKQGEAEAEEMVAAACERIGLPRPREVVLMPGSLFIGAPPAKHFPTLPAKYKKTLGYHTHALLIFSELVRGPVLLGAGRYRGYGLCRPYRSGG